MPCGASSYRIYDIVPAKHDDCSRAQPRSSDHEQRKEEKTKEQESFHCVTPPFGFPILKVDQRGGRQRRSPADMSSTSVYKIVVAAPIAGVFLKVEPCGGQP